MAESFAQQLQAFADKAKGNAQTVVRQVALDIMNRVVMRTPVGNPELWKVNQHGMQLRGTYQTFAAHFNASGSGRRVSVTNRTMDKKFGKLKAPAGYVGGRLRANWNVSLGSPDESTTADTDKGGAATIGRGSDVISTYKGEDIYLTNSLPYAIPVEYGHSIKQAPAGMVRVTVAEFQSYVAAEAAKVSK